MAILNVAIKVVAFGDEQVNSNPRLKYVDWLRDLSGITVSDPKAEAHRIEVGGTRTVFDGTRATTLDGTTAFSLALLAIAGGSRYRITHTGGTNPTFRTGRNLTPTGMTLTVVVNANATVTLTSSAPLFGAVLAGDEIFIPNTTTGDAANLFSVLNSGYWQVLGVTSTTNITLVRPAGQSFEATGEAVVLISNSQLRAYSAAGVQVGDSAAISAGFAAASRSTFPVVAVTDAFVEILSTPPLPAEAGILPGATGLIFYQEVKNFIYLETSQEIAVRLNGDTTDIQVVRPLDASDPNRPGPYMKYGPVWRLILVNKAASAALVTIIHAED